MAHTKGTNNKTMNRDDVERAADLLEWEAHERRSTNTTPQGEWPPDEDSQRAKRDVEEYESLASRLRELAKTLA